MREWGPRGGYAGFILALICFALGTWLMNPVLVAIGLVGLPAGTAIGYVAVGSFGDYLNDRDLDKLRAEQQADRLIWEHDPEFAESLGIERPKDYQAPFVPKARPGEVITADAQGVPLSAVGMRHAQKVAVARAKLKGPMLK